MADASGWAWIATILPYLIFGLIFMTIAGMLMAWLGPLLGLWSRRRRHVRQKIVDYDQEFVNDQKAACKANPIPCRELYTKDPDDWEQPMAYWGKIVGGIGATDVVELCIRRPWKIFTKVVWIPRSKMSDLHTKKLTVYCAGITCVNGLYWVPEWGSRIDPAAREKLVDQVENAIETRYTLFGKAVVREARLAMTEKAMQPGAASRSSAFREPEVVNAASVDGVEDME